MWYDGFAAGRTFSATVEEASVNVEALFLCVCGGFEEIRCGRCGR